MQKTKLSKQIALSLFATALLVGLAIGEVERHLETKRLNTELEEQADLTVSLIAGLLIEAILVRDTPVIDTALEQAIDLNPTLLSITVFDNYGTRMSHRSDSVTVTENNSRKYTKDITYDDENLGSMDITWSTTQGQKMITDNVNHVRLSTFITLALISALFLALVSKLAMRPLHIIHERMTRTIAREPVENYQLSKFASFEFNALNESVTTLETALSERDQREEALHIASETAARASKAKSEFLANMSHEIRTPMNGVIGMAELILETDLDRDQKTYAETISKSGSALLTIINDILDFSKIEAGKLELDPTPFDLNKALEDIVTLVAAKASQKDVEVSLRYDPTLPCGFYGDVGRIRQIMTNIVGNAAKFTLNGYVLINVTGKQLGDSIQLRFDIEDTGIGIEKEKIDSIFNEFEQVDGAANRNFEGTGLGLAISTRLIKMMGGKVSVKSTVGKGSVFTVLFDLPISNDVPTEEEFESDLTGKHALIVDDLTVNLNILAERLRSWGVMCQTAPSGNSALGLLQDKHIAGEAFDFAILDFQMPEMDGAMLTEHIRDYEYLDKLPLILLSSVDQSVDLATKKRLKIDETLLKPTRSNILRSAIVSALKMENCQVSKISEQINEPDQDISQIPIDILIAEDNKTNQLVLKSMLKKQNTALTIAQNGREAVECYAKNKPDLILMDMSMPEMDGLEATQKIRLFEVKNTMPRTPIIALTANAMKGDRERCIKAGMDDYLSKPIRKDKLLETIKNWHSSQLLNKQPGINISPPHQQNIRSAKL